MTKKSKAIPKPEKVRCVYCKKLVKYDKAQAIGYDLYRCKAHRLSTMLKYNDKLNKKVVMNNGVG